jgi:hypothetical protein
MLQACSERSLEDLHTLCVEGGASTSGASTPRASTPVQGAASALQRQQQLSSRYIQLCMNHLHMESSMYHTNPATHAWLHLSNWRDVLDNLHVTATSWLVKPISQS